MYAHGSAGTASSNTDVPNHQLSLEHVKTFPKHRQQFPEKEHIDFSVLGTQNKGHWVGKQNTVASRLYGPI
jgi:hypothetical protein